LRILHVFDNDQVRECTDVAGFWIDVDAQIASRAHALFRSREQCVGYRLEEDVAFDPALPLQVIQHGDKFCVHKNI
jgi:hypothetical protein